MRRRTFIGLSIGAIAAFTAWRILGSSDYDAIVTILEKRLNYLRKDPEGMKQFARDLSARGDIDSKRLRLISATKPLYNRFALSGDNRFAHAIRHGEDRVCSNYLMSSDFFLNGADESRIVKYLGFYDPLRPCGNPFARFRMETDV